MGTNEKVCCNVEVVEQRILEFKQGEGSCSDKRGRHGNFFPKNERKKRGETSVKTFVPFPRLYNREYPFQAFMSSGDRETRFPPLSLEGSNMTPHLKKE